MMGRKFTYLDFNATAIARPEVIEKVSEVMTEGGNPSSVHDLGRRALAHVDEARHKVASLLGARARDVVFTGGGTESNALGLKGIIASLGIERLIISSVEHPSVRDLAGAVDCEVLVVPVDANGLVERAALLALLETDKKTLVSFMLANNETGVINPIEELAKPVKTSGALFHCDAIQAAGKIPVSFTELGVDLLSVSAHKLAGPQGVGCLIMKSGLELEPLTHGGGQEVGRRSGTENVAGIAGFGVAAELAEKNMSDGATLAAWRNEMEAQMKRAVPTSVVIGRVANRLPNTSLVALPGVAADSQVIQMDLAGYAVSSGSACSSGKVSRSHVLDAMAVGDELAGSALRISSGWSTTEEDIKAFTGAWIKMAARMIKNSKPVEGVTNVAS